jgi:hypothetical protein
MTYDMSKDEYLAWFNSLPESEKREEFDRLLKRMEERDKKKEVAD